MRGAAVAALLLALAFGVPNAAGAADPYVIHAIVPLTGPNAFLGKGEAATLNAIEGLVNKRGGVRGRPIAFSIQDDASDPVKSVQLINQLSAQNVPFVLGPSGLQSCTAAMPIIANTGPLQYCFSNGVRPILGSFEFSSAPKADDMIAVAVRYMHRRGWTRVAIIASIDASGQEGERGILAAMARPENQGFTVVAREHFAPADISVSAQMSRIADAKPQVVYAWSTGTPMATILRAYSEEDLHVPMFASAGNLTYVQMEQYKNYLPAEVYFGAPAQFGPNAIASDRALKSTVDTFLATMRGVGIRADYGPVAAWDPTMLMIDALQRFGFDLTAAQLHTYIAGLKGWVGADGRYDFVANPQRGLSDTNCLVVRWEPGSGTWVGVSKLGGAPL
jgi:ABC-type branched-subunit amino acid transport system substrate-binding protein